MEETVVKEEVKETQPASTDLAQTESREAASGEAVKEPPKETSTDKVPYSRFSEVIAQKNEAVKKAQEFENRLKEIESKIKPQQEEVDPFANLSSEERRQAEDYAKKFVAPLIMKDLKPFISEIQTERLNKQISEAQKLAKKADINFDERLPEIQDFLSRPENKGRLTAREAFLSLYGDELMEKSSLKGKEEISKETKELMDKKKLANTQVVGINQNSVIQSDEGARRQMAPSERLQMDLKKAYDLAQQGVKNPKVRIE